MLRPIATLVILAGGLVFSGPASASPPRADCNVVECRELAIRGDAPARLPNGDPSPFRGFADATMRAEPGDASVIHLAYSWPHLRRTEASSRRRARPGGRFRREAGRQPGVSPAVETHYAISRDGGASFALRGVLWAPPPMIHPETGERGHVSVETPNLLAVATSAGTLWFGARLEYFLPEQGGFRARSLDTFRIAVLTGSSPERLDESGAVRLGAAATGAQWADVSLAALAQDARRCTIWNEPALAFESGVLYLALSCQTIVRGRPRPEQDAIMLFATIPAGEPVSWSWRYVGVLADAADAAAFGADRFSQIELSYDRAGSPIALLTPDRWSETTGDWEHRGCLVFQIASFSEAELARDAEGAPRLVASVAPRGDDQGDTGACAYDPESQTGILVGWRRKEGAGLGAAGQGGALLEMVQRITGLHP